MKRIAGVFLATVLVSGLASLAPAQAQSTWEQIEKSGKIRVGFIPNRTPYQYVEGGKVKGFIDTMTRDFTAQLGQKLGKQMDRTQSWILREAVESWITWKAAEQKVLIQNGDLPPAALEQVRE